MKCLQNGLISCFMQLKSKKTRLTKVKIQVNVTSLKKVIDM